MVDSETDGMGRYVQGALAVLLLMLGVAFSRDRVVWVDWRLFTGPKSQITPIKSGATGEKEVPREKAE